MAESSGRKDVWMYPMGHGISFLFIIYFFVCVCVCVCVCDHIQKQGLWRLNQLKTKSRWSSGGPKSGRHRDTGTQGSRERAAADEGRDWRVAVTGQGVLVTDRNWEETRKDSCLEPSKGAAVT